MANGRDGDFFASPHAAVYLLIGANIVVFALCAWQSGGDAIPGELLFRSGAMYSAAIERHEYWRLVAYGFLHANVLHIATNMLCLALWGGHLERRVGPFYFIVIYLCALIGGAVVGRYTHADPYLTVGASGGITRCSRTPTMVRECLLARRPRLVGPTAAASAEVRGHWRDWRAA